MAFCVPEKYRVTGGPLATTRAYGNNGAFIYHDLVKRNTFKCIASDGAGWEHVSVSMPTRTPTWKEMCMIKKLFWGKEDCVIQFHPRESEYINYHSHCLHLWRPTNGVFPRPNPALVGPYEPEKKD